MTQWTDVLPPIDVNIRARRETAPNFGAPNNMRRTVLLNSSVGLTSISSARGRAARPISWRTARLFGRLASAAIALSCIIPAWPGASYAAPPPDAPASAQRLSHEQLQALLQKGARVTSPPGAPYNRDDWYKQDGAFISKADRADFVGIYRIEGDEVCVERPGYRLCREFSEVSPGQYLEHLLMKGGGTASTVLIKRCTDKAC